MRSADNDKHLIGFGNRHGLARPVQEKDLTDGCKKALALIFKICDMDNDGVMSDTGGF